jgi:hypothetical protein
MGFGLPWSGSSATHGTSPANADSTIPLTLTPTYLLQLSPGGTRTRRGQLMLRLAGTTPGQSTRPLFPTGSIGPVRGRRGYSLAGLPNGISNQSPPYMIRHYADPVTA